MSLAVEEDRLAAIVGAVLDERLRPLRALLEDVQRRLRDDAGHAEPKLPEAGWFRTKAMLRVLKDAGFDETPASFRRRYRDNPKLRDLARGRWHLEWPARLVVQWFLDHYQ